jgi:hypothetical protein
LITPGSPTDPDKRPDAAQPAEQTKKDNRVIDIMVFGWLVLGVLALIILAVT